MQTISKINVNKVKSVYSGRPGCCCGCQGKHSYASATRIEAGKSRGYEVSDDEVSDRSVKMIVNKLNKLIFLGDPSIEANDQYVAYNGHRTLIAYFN